MSQSSNVIPDEFWFTRPESGHALVFDGEHLKSTREIPDDYKVIYDRGGIYRCCAKHLKLPEDKVKSLISGNDDSHRRLIYVRFYTANPDELNDLIPIEIDSNNFSYFPVNPSSSTAEALQETPNCKMKFISYAYTLRRVILRGVADSMFFSSVTLESKIAAEDARKAQSQPPSSSWCSCFDCGDNNTDSGENIPLDPSCHKMGR